MKLGPVKDVPFRQIIGPGDVPKRQKTQNVLDLAEDFKKYGRPLHPLTLQKTKRGLEVVIGRDRFSAGALVKAKSVPAQVVLEATPAELLEIEIKENLHRRHDDKAVLTKRLVDKAEAVVSARVSANADAEPAGPGRPVTPRGEARRLVAEQSGRTVEAVRKAETRAKEREEAQPGNRDTAQAAPAAPPIDTHGRAFPAGWIPRVEIINEALDAMDKAARAAQAACSLLDGSSAKGIGGWKPALLQRLRELFHTAGAQARAARPAHVCPLCTEDRTVYDVDAKKPHCKLCGDERTLTQEQWDALPAEQRDGVVAPDAYMSGPTKKHTRTAKKVRVDLGDGVDRTVEEAERELTIERIPPEPEGDDGELW
jgi:hypothetical protein